MHTGVAVEAGPVVRAAELPCGVCRALTGGVVKTAEAVKGECAVMRGALAFAPRQRLQAALHPR